MPGEPERTMIERLPLDIFEDRDGDTDPEPPDAPGPVEAIAPTPDEEAPPTPSATSFTVSCQWCGELFDNELDRCPHCEGIHHRLASPDDDDEALNCQWCLATVEAGSERCPECGARIVVPGQFIAGMDDPLTPLSSASFETRVQQTRTQQMLASMMLGGGVDSLVGGLIGLALTIFDD